MLSHTHFSHLEKKKCIIEMFPNAKYLIVPLKVAFRKTNKSMDRVICKKNLNMSFFIDGLSTKYLKYSIRENDQQCYRYSQHLPEVLYQLSTAT